jgi:hypothetical protein
MRMGRGVSLNRFGTFSFGPSEFSNEVKYNFFVFWFCYDLKETITAK